MPRERNGKPFGIGTRVRTEIGTEFTVCGFAVFGHAISRQQAEKIARIACDNCEQKHPTIVRYWREVSVVDHPDNPPYKELESHVDTCLMDVAQVNGLDATAPREDITQAAARQFGGDADKVVWGN